MQRIPVEILDGPCAQAVVPDALLPRLGIVQGRRVALEQVHERVREDDGSYFYVYRGCRFPQAA